DWKTLRKHNHDLIVEGRKLLLKALGAEAPCPENMLGSLATVQLPIPFKAPESNFNYIHPFWQKLMNEYHIQTPVFGWSRTNPRWWLRIAVQAYNSIEQVQYLAEVLKKEFPQ
ncbi:MAG: aminotransferase, partial [Bacteroidota bacterium]